MRPRTASIVDNEREEDREDLKVELLEVEGSDAEMRRIAREEIASLCGLMLNRLGNSNQPGTVRIAAAWAEALRDFGATADEPGPEVA